jgi:uncharacterized protein YgiM (DUF1202 family)
MKKILLVVFASLLLLKSYAENYTASQDLNVRKGSSSSAEVIGQITKSTVVDVTTIEGNWGKINYQGQDGYVSMKFLEKVATESDSGTQTTTSTHSSSSSSTGTWFVVIVVIVLLLYFRNTSLVKGLFGIAGGFVNKAVQNEANTVEYRCHYCGNITKVRPGNKLYTGTMCKSGKTHDWRRIN